MSRRKSKPIGVVGSVEPVDRFGSPQLVNGEDLTEFNELVAQFRAAVKPADTIEEMLLNDFVSSTWEVMRWRRVKSCLLRSAGLKGLEPFLIERFDYKHYRKEAERHIKMAFDGSGKRQSQG